MNLVKRGIISIIRKPGKTIILLLIIFILGNIICGAISIRQAVENTDNNLRAQMSPVVTLSIDYNKVEKLYNNGDTDVWDNIKTVSIDTIKEIGELSYVKSYDYTTSTSMMSRSLESYTEDENTYYGGYYFQCLGGQDPEIFDMRQNKIKLVSGRTFTDDEINSLSYVAVISQNFAEKNNLTTGSKFTLDNVVFDENYTGDYENYSDEDAVAIQTYEFEVVGIFEPIKEVGKDSDGRIDFGYSQQIENTIYTTNKVVESAVQFLESEYSKLYDVEPSDEMYYETYYVLNDPLELDAFKEQASEFLPEYYIVDDSSASYESVAAPMKTIQQIATIVLYVAIVASLIILSLLITLFLRDRKHEIGIYLSLGEAKVKVITQVLLEVVIVAVLAISLSLFSGNVLAGSISQTMLNNQIASQQEDDNSSYGSYSTSSLEYRGYGSSISSEDIQESYEVSLNTTTVLLFVAVGIGTVIVSTLIPIIYITRLNPKKIMM